MTWGIPTGGRLGSETQGPAYQTPLTPAQLQYIEAGGGGTLAQQLAALGGNPGGPTPGSYDPAIDSAILNAKTGLAQKLAGLTTQGQRGDTGFLLGTQAAQHANAVALADAAQKHDYTSQDIARARGLLGQQQDWQTAAHQTAVGNLSRQYQQLGENQAQRAESTGNGDGGALSAALIARGRNESIARQPIDTRYAQQQQAGQNRSAQLDVQQQRADTGYHELTDPYNPANPAGGRLAYSLAQQEGQLGLTHSYQTADQQTAATNAQTSYDQFLLGEDAQKAYTALPNPAAATSSAGVNVPSTLSTTGA